jgi:4-diphosphocytidyl-2-C-methyl-D-erythritol kinase
VAVAMSGSGPSLFALFPDRSLAEQAHTELASSLQQAGFEAWVCRCTGSGATLV